ncbi:hypothetical protein NPIL_541151 [Nephila pilipes]|uniref:Secreted protein n=1 Tax=Nephila pilipes TaxID=299642 RepID=A0A8X6N8K8_NEPPI|nr:hypothetical protein NPIL_541151 [Nephila pilipes]
MPLRWSAMQHTARRLLALVAVPRGALKYAAASPRRGGSRQSVLRTGNCKAVSPLRVGRARCVRKCSATARRFWLPKGGTKQGSGTCQMYIFKR